MRYAVILAGGSGTRLWPASRQARPKQLLPLGPGGETLLEAALRRGRAICGERLVIVTAASQEAATRAVAGEVELLAEPTARNTAAALGLAAATLAARDPDAVLVVLPADQHIADEPGLTAKLELVLGAVERDDVIGTIGIPPTRPETGFGYLETAAPSAAQGTDQNPGVVPVARFVEKPDAATAVRYLGSGRHLWNAGMFVVSARRLLAELDAHLPETGRAMRDIAAGRASAAEVYPALPSISIDHAVMEKASGVVTAPAAVGWDDVGSWAALPAVAGQDGDGNTIVGDAVVVDGTGNVLVSDGDALLATVGLSDIVVVKSGDAILVIRKDRAQDVRQVVEALSASGRTRYL